MVEEVIRYQYSNRRVPGRIHVSGFASVSVLAMIVRMATLSKVMRSAQRKLGMFCAKVFAGLFVFLVLLTGCVGCFSSQKEDSDKVVINYWEKWSGFEGRAMREVVDDFNDSQDRIFVNFLKVSKIDRKLMLATAGGNPPDVAGLFSWILPVYVENGALLPLDKYAREAGIRSDDYIDIFWQMCRHRGHLWALPTTPASNALHWNKKLFREAGLDPERPPRTIAELERFNEQLLRRSPVGKIEIMGHLPQEPGWWVHQWGRWFGGSLWDGEETVTAYSPENLAAFQWIASYPRRFGVEDLLAFRDGFGNFASPQNAFFQGRVAMVLQGPWMYNFIQNYAPEDFEWGVAPFPGSGMESGASVTIAESDVLVIPKGAAHPREAFEFIRYVNRREVMEKLCLAHRKFSPFKEVTPGFVKKHPNPYIEVFIELAKSPGAKSPPNMATWAEYRDDLIAAANRVSLLEGTAEEVLREVQERQQKALDRKSKRWKRVEKQRMKEWDEL